MALPQRIAVIDYGTGNLTTVCRRLDAKGVCVAVAATAAEVLQADKVVLPGVGHFGAAMQQLRAAGLIDALCEVALVRRAPVLGICLGMQLMAARGEEGGCDGLGWLDGEVVRIAVSDRHRYKVPHIGWGTARAMRESALLRGLSPEAEFYFVHAYSFLPRDRSTVLAESDHELPFVSAIERDNLLGVQFHPEKSREPGARLLRNFVEL